VADDRTNTLLEAAGYHELKRIDRWEVGTMAYRLPVNRDLLLLQRSTRVQRIATPALEPTVAAMLIQFEREWYSVVDMRRGIPLGSIEVWTSDPEAMVMPSNEAILASWSLPPSSPTETSLKAPGDDTAIRHLIASVIPELTQRRITSLHRCVLTDDTLHAATLIAAGFSRTSVGRLLTKKISH
jgi:hypothetical protein